MAKSFDKLVDSNLQLVTAVRLALIVLVLLSAASSILTIYASWNMRTTILGILQQCYKEKQ